MFAPALIFTYTYHYYPAIIRFIESIMQNIKYLAHRLRHPHTTIHPDKINWFGSRGFGMKYALHFRRFQRPALLMWDTNIHDMQFVTYKNPADTFGEFMVLHAEYMDYCHNVAQDTDDDLNDYKTEPEPAWLIELNKITDHMKEV